MAAIVLVHGIGQQAETAETLAASWVGSMSRSFGPFAHGLGSRLAELSAMAAYADLLDDPLDSAPVVGDDRVVSDLAAAILRRAADSDDRDTADAASERLRGLEGIEEQGLTEPVRVLVSALASIPRLGWAGFKLAERALWRDLRQVSRYFDRRETRIEAQNRVEALIDDTTRIVIAHSLGTVVAYETLHRTGRCVPVLVTLGSPLGLDTVIAPRLEPRLSMPDRVARWYNLADRDDIVAARPDLGEFFADSARAPVDVEVSNPGIMSGWHSADGYLSQPEVALALLEAFGG